MYAGATSKWYNSGSQRLFATASCCCCCLLLFLTFSALVANPKKLLYTVANPARGLVNRGKKEKKVWQRPPPPARALLVRRKKKKKNHATHPHV